MSELVKDVMTADPITVAAGDQVVEAAKRMRDAAVGSMIVIDGDEIRGIVTDRDIAVRLVAEGRDPAQTTVQEIVSPDPVTVEPDTAIEDAIGVMSERAIRRLPVVEQGRPVGIVSLGDLAIDRDPGSVLGEISAASPDR
ncbi:MAG TPA: CBS domain-containing protein [Gaiellales bacterium]|nr:CBS domain-containing protein [Gaiellales bacterium]